MPRDNAEDGIDNFLQDLDDLLQGRYYFTLYCQYSNEHNRLFHSKRIKRCLYYAFLFTLLLQLLDALFYDKDALVATENTKVTQELLTKTVNYVDAPKPKSHFQNDDFASPRTSSDNGEETFKKEQGQDQSKSLMEDRPNIMSNPFSPTYHWVDISAGFLLKYMFVTVSLYASLYLIPALASILYNVYVRHVIAKSKNNLIYGLFRFQRVRHKND